MYLKLWMFTYGMHLPLRGSFANGKYSKLYIPMGYYLPMVCVEASNLCMHGMPFRMWINIWSYSTLCVPELTFLFIN